MSRPERADMVLALRSRAGDSRLRRILAVTDLPLHEVKKNSNAQIRRLMQDLFNVLPGVDDRDVRDAVREAEDGVQQVREEGVPVELPPRPASLRQLQHRIVVRNSLVAEGVGSEPQRHLVIRP